MTAAQRIMLFKLFSQAMTASGITGSTARDLERERITKEVLGAVRSWSTFNNYDVDLMKAALEAMINPGNLDAQVRQINMPRARLIYSIRKFDAAYWQKIARDKFDGKTDLDKLTDAQLVQLRNTLHNRRKPKPQLTPEEPF